MTMIDEETREEMTVAISKTLTEREQKVIQLRFGLDGEDEHSPAETALKLDLPIHAVVAAEFMAVRKLRRRLKNTLLAA